MRRRDGWRLCRENILATGVLIYFGYPLSERERHRAGGHGGAKAISAAEETEEHVSEVELPDCGEDCFSNLDAWRKPRTNSPMP